MVGLIHVEIRVLFRSVQSLRARRTKPFQHAIRVLSFEHERFPHRMREQRNVWSMVQRKLTNRDQKRIGEGIKGAAGGCAMLYTSAD